MSEGGREEGREGGRAGGRERHGESCNILPPSLTSKARHNIHSGGVRT